MSSRKNNYGPDAKEYLQEDESFPSKVIGKFRKSGKTYYEIINNRGEIVLIEGYKQLIETLSHTVKKLS